MNRIQRILMLCRYDSNGSSSRLRLMQYIPYLRANGMHVKVSPLLDNQYVDSIYLHQGYPKFRIIKSYLNRLLILLSSRNYDLLLIEKELFPWLPAWVEQLLSFFGKPCIVDYDDAIFHSYDKNPNKIIRFLLKNKIAGVMRASSAVIAGNKYLSQYALSAGAKNVYIVPTVIDLNKYFVPKKTKSGAFVIGWIGSPSTTRYLKLIEQALTELSTRYPVKLVVVGGSEIKMGNLPIERKEWSEKSEVSEIQAFDAGVMPLIDGEWEKGKCGYKLVQYMACGIPVIASPVGVNSGIISHGIDGFLAKGQDEWVHYLSLLAENPDICSKLGAAGRKKVELNYCIQVTAPVIRQILSNLAEIPA